MRETSFSHKQQKSSELFRGRSEAKSFSLLLFPSLSITSKLSKDAGACAVFVDVAQQRAAAETDAAAAAAVAAERESTNAIVSTAAFTSAPRPLFLFSRPVSPLRPPAGRPLVRDGPGDARLRSGL